jgi:hypothetical protein
LIHTHLVGCLAVLVLAGPAGATDQSPAATPDTAIVACSYFDIGRALSNSAADAVDTDLVQLLAPANRSVADSAFISAVGRRYTVLNSDTLRHLVGEKAERGDAATLISSLSILRDRGVGYLAFGYTLTVDTLGFSAFSTDTTGGRLRRYEHLVAVRFGACRNDTVSCLYRVVYGAAMDFARALAGAGL